MENVYKTFGRRLKEIRRKNKLTQTELAQNLNISQSSLTQYEKGNKRVSLGFAYTVARFFHVSLDELFIYDMKYSSNRQSTLISMSKIEVELYRNWTQDVGVFVWTETEYNELMNFTKYVLYKRTHDDKYE